MGREQFAGGATEVSKSLPYSWKLGFVISVKLLALSHNKIRDLDALFQINTPL